MHTPPEAVEPAGVQPEPVVIAPVVVIGSVTLTVVPLSVIEDCCVIVVAVVPFGMTLLACPDTVPDPPPPPPERAEAVDWMMLTVVVPPTSVDIRIRTLVYPAVLACHVPVLDVEVAAVVELLGVAFKATQVVPPSPDASN